MTDLAPMTRTPNKEELLRMLEQCVENPNAQTWNWRVADLLRHYLELRESVPAKTLEKLRKS